VLFQLSSNSLEETIKIGQLVGRSLDGGELIELVSDVGGGKTTFVKGLAKGLDVRETIQSPTFTISRVYRCRDGLELHHFDFYRLEDPGILLAELEESLDDPQAIVVIEWAGIVERVLPDQHIRIDFITTSEEGRRLEVSIPDGAKKLSQALTKPQKADR